MTTAEAALRQLLADVEAARRKEGRLFCQTPFELDYLEKLARDGLPRGVRCRKWSPVDPSRGYHPRYHCILLIGHDGDHVWPDAAMVAKAGT